MFKENSAAGFKINSLAEEIESNRLISLMASLQILSQRPTSELITAL